MTASGTGSVDGLAGGPVEGLLSPGDVTELADEVEALLHNDPVRAEALAGSARPAAERLGMAVVQARLSYALARLHAERGELDEALGLIDEARALWERGGSPLSAARTDLGRMQILDDLGRHQESLAVGRRLLSMLDDLRMPDPADPEAISLAAMLRAAALGNIGVAYSFLGQHEESLRSYDGSERLYAELGMTVQVAQQHANRGIELLALGRAREALAAMRDSEEEFRRAGDRVWSAKCAAHAAEAYQQLGSFVKALVTLDGARAELAALGATAEEARVHLQLSRVQLEAGLLPEAAESARQAHRLADQASLTHDAALAQFVLASVHLKAHQLPEAEAAAVASARAFEGIGDRQFQGRAALLLAQVSLASDDARADDELAHAVDLLADGGWRLPLAWALLEQSQRPGPVGPQAWGRAQSLAAELGIPALTQAVAVRHARHAWAVGHHDVAVAELRRTVADIDVRGRGLGDPLLRLATQNSTTEAHDLLVALLVERGGPGDAAEALAVSDTAKAQTLRDLMGASGAGAVRRWTSMVPEDEAADLIAELNAAYAGLSEAPSAADRDRLLDRARALEARLGTLRLGTSLRGTDDADGSAPQPYASGLEAAVGPALCYHVSAGDVVAFVVDHAGTVAARVLAGAANRSERHLALLSSQWARFAIGPSFTERHGHALERTTHVILRRLYDELVAPVSDLLESVQGSELTLVAHKGLHRVPFAALHDGSLHPLLESWTVTFSPVTPRGARAVPGTSTDDAPAEEPSVLVLSVPDERAPHIAAEADRIRAIVSGADVLVDRDATAAALATRLPGPDIVHLACHGLHRPDNPLFSSLRLADRWVTGADLLDLDLSGVLLVLSACESGETGRQTAEPIGLAWAALAAGARGVLVSRWVLDDEVAVELMSHLYDGLVRGEPPAAALRLAQATVARGHPHPYFWAPMTFVSPPTPPGRRSP